MLCVSENCKKMLNETVPTAGPFFLRAKFSIFTTGKVYNCDLSASKNIGARFFIRVLLKSLSVKEELLVLAKVPELNRRTSCCLATLINAYAVFCASKAKPEALAEGNAARQSH